MTNFDARMDAETAAAAHSVMEQAFEDGSKAHHMGLPRSPARPCMTLAEKMQFEAGWDQAESEHE